ncbi:Protease [Coniochaeta hoffmannii]|uniref:Protease n=1 Tax=Coniochaeta hoffmannii TaxID=91930 RepID=A0AA38VUN3_9PEZI|nr:Protease [Coniochaeta hoffmannii]
MRLLLPLLFASAAAAELTFTASTVQDGKEVDVSTKDFVKMPPRSRPHHRWRGTNSTGGSSSSEHKRATSISLSSTWCGMSQKHADSQDPIKTVFGAFQAPNLHDRTGTYPQFAAAWVGIDGSSCQQALLQAGVTTTLNSNGGQSASAWFEWYPEASYTIPSSTLRVTAGDWLEVNVTASSASAGQVTLINLSRNIATTVTLVNGPALCRQDADWIVEDFDSGGKPVPFARFDDVWFEECAATTLKGNAFGLNGATPIYMGSSAAAASCVATPYDGENFVCSSQN